MKTKHTPGPWEVKAGSWDHEGCVRYSLSGITDLKAADARLISAAPEMFEALQDLVRINEEHNQSFIDVIGKPLNWKDEYLDSARAAIRKALGEEK